MGSSNSIHFTIINDTKFDIVSSRAYHYDPFDWEHHWSENSTPDLMLNSLKIGKGERYACTLSIHKGATKCPFTLSLRFKDNLEDIVRITAQDIRSGHPNANPLETIKKSHDVECTWETKDEFRCTLTIKHTNDQLVTMKIDDAEKNRKKQRFKEALQDLEEAFDISTTDDQKKKITQLSAKIYAKQAEIYENKGLASELNTDEDNSKIAEHNFLEAITSLEQAIALDPKNEYTIALARIKEKRAGNKLVNEANEAEKKGHNLFIKEDYEGAQRQYELAKQMMLQAEQKFEACLKGNTRYQGCLNVVQEEVAAIQDTTHDLQVLQLKQNMKKLQVDENRTKDTVVVEEDIRLV